MNDRDGGQPIGEPGEDLNATLLAVGTKFIFDTLSSVEQDPQTSTFARNEARRLRGLIENGTILLNFEEHEGWMNPGFRTDSQKRAIPQINLNPIFVLGLAGRGNSEDQTDAEYFTEEGRKTLAANIRPILQNYDRKSEQLRKQGFRVVSVEEWRDKDFDTFLEFQQLPEAPLDFLAILDKLRQRGNQNVDHIRQLLEERRIVVRDLPEAGLQLAFQTKEKLVTLAMAAPIGYVKGPHVNDTQTGYEGIAMIVFGKDFLSQANHDEEKLKQIGSQIDMLYKIFFQGGLKIVPWPEDIPDGFFRDFIGHSQKWAFDDKGKAFQLKSD